MSRFASTLLLVCLLVTGTAPVQAAPDNQQVISRQEAAKRAQQIRPGRVLSIELRNKPPAPPTYRVKILQQGDVHLLNIDASSSSGKKNNAGARRRR